MASAHPPGHPGRRQRHLRLLACLAAALHCSLPGLSAWVGAGQASARPGVPAAAQAVARTEAVDVSVLRLRSPAGARLWLIGTAHVSNRDAELVGEVIAEQRPDAVVVELDPARLPRLNLTLGDLGDRAVVPPPEERSQEGFEPWDPRGWAAAAAAPAIRTVLTGMYDGLTARGMQAGGEFAAAIRTGKEVGARIVLADVESVQTIESFLGNVVRGNPLEFMQRYMTVMDKELGDKLGDREMTPELVEQLKREVRSDGRFFDKLRDQIPEFHSAFIQARDERMANAVKTEAQRGGKAIVGVVGLGHVPGMEKELAAQGWVRE